MASQSADSDTSCPMVNGGRQKGAGCSSPHELGALSKQGRCWERGSARHMKPDRPTLFDGGRRRRNIWANHSKARLENPQRRDGQDNGVLPRRRAGTILAMPTFGRSLRS